MSKHTPGPWAAHKSQSVLGGNVYYISQQEGAPYTPNYSDVCQTVEGEQEEIQLSNANLIAAAPELLEALKNARAELEEIALSEGGDPYNNPEMNEAINKAEGKA